MQSRWMSFIESLTNILVGYGVAVAAQIAVFPLFNINLDLHTNMQIGAIFSAVSIARSYILRRLFNSLK